MLAGEPRDSRTGSHAKVGVVSMAKLTEAMESDGLLPVLLFAFLVVRDSTATDPGRRQ